MPTERQTILAPLKLEGHVQPVDSRLEFIERVQAMMAHVQTHPFAEELDLQKEALKAFYCDYFRHVNDWAEVETGKHRDESNDQNVLVLKNAAVKARQDLEDNIINFACCYMSICHAKGVIAASAKLHKPTSKNGENKDIKWTKATTRMLYKNIINRQELIKSSHSLAVGLHVLEQFEKTHGSLQDLSETVFGHKAASKALKPIYSPLRNGDFTKAEKALNSLSIPKNVFSRGKKEDSVDALKAALGEYIILLKKHVDSLHIDPNSERIFLSKKEVKVSLITQMKELENTEQFLNKYFMPYIGYTTQGFSRLQDKLLVVGSLEYLITLYIKMITGVAQPLQTLKEVREYESDVVGKVQFLLNTQFKEIDNIQHISNEDITVFTQNLQIFKDVIA